MIGRVRTALSIRAGALVERLAAEEVLPRLAPRLYRPRGRRPPPPERVRSVLVWNLDAIGDLLLVTPALRALRAGYPRAAITVACHRGSADVLACDPHVDRLVAVDGTLATTARGIVAPPGGLPRERFDVMLVLEMGSRPADAGRLFGRRHDAGYLVAGFAGLLKPLADFTLPRNEAEPWPAYFLRATDHLGLPGVPPAPVLALGRDDEAAAHAALRAWEAAGGPRPVVALHPGVAPYAGRTKQWPAERFVRLGALLASRAAPSRAGTSSARAGTSSARAARAATSADQVPSDPPRDPPGRDPAASASAARAGTSSDEVASDPAARAVSSPAPASRAPRLVLTGSRDEADLCARVAAGIRAAVPGADVVDASGRFALRPLAALYRAAAAVVTGDTAPLHLAAAAGGRVVALFGATDPARLAPEGAVVLTAHVPCRPCHAPRDRAPFWPTCLYPRPECLVGIPAERVAAEVEALLDRPVPRGVAP